MQGSRSREGGGGRLGNNKKKRRIDNIATKVKGEHIKSKECKRHDFE